MSVLIKGIEIPKNCLECMFRMSYWKRALTPSGEIFTYGCMLNGKEINILEKRCKDCPIDEIPTPHGRLIDADKAAHSILMMSSHPCGCSIENVKDVVKWLRFVNGDGNNFAFPTIIEAEVSE